MRVLNIKLDRSSLMVDKMDKSAIIIYRELSTNTSKYRIQKNEINVGQIQKCDLPI